MHAPENELFPEEFTPMPLHAVGALKFIVALLFCTLALASDEAALLKAITAHPGEDTPRLMYADWLEEHGQPERARFIRIQIERAALPRTSPRYAHLEGIEAGILKEFETKWLPPVLTKLRANEFKATWERGWISKISVVPEALNRGEVRDAIDSLDFLKGVFINGGFQDASPLLKLKSLNRLTYLGFFNITGQQVERIAQANVPNLRRFQLQMRGEGGFEALASSKLARQLTELRLMLGTGILANLANHSSFQNLESLIIEGWGDPDDLCNREGLPALHSLELRLYNLDFESRETANEHVGDVARFFNTKEFRALRRFVLRVDSSNTETLLPSAERLLNTLAASEHNLTEFELIRDGEPAQLPGTLYDQLEKNRDRLGCARMVALLSAT